MQIYSGISDPATRHLGLDRQEWISGSLAAAYREHLAASNNSYKRGVMEEKIQDMDPGGEQPELTSFLTEETLAGDSSVTHE